MAKDLTKLYSRPGAEAYHVFEDDNGQVQVKMGRGLRTEGRVLR